MRIMINISFCFSFCLAKLDELSNFKVSGKVGQRWAKVKTVSKFSSMIKTPRNSEGSLERRQSSQSLERQSSARSNKSRKSKDGGKKNKKL